MNILIIPSPYLVTQRFKDKMIDLPQSDFLSSQFLRFLYIFRREALSS